MFSVVGATKYHAVFYDGSWRYVPGTANTWRWAGGVCGGGYGSCSHTHDGRDPHWCYRAGGARSYIASCQQTACPVHTTLMEMAGTHDQVFMNNGYYNYDPVSSHQSGSLFTYSGSTYHNMKEGYVPAFSPGCLSENFYSICIPGACEINPGYYSDFKGGDYQYGRPNNLIFVTNPIEVKPCEAGFQCNNGNMVQCNAGTYQSSEAMSYCDNCANGSTSEPGATSCTSCPANLYSNRTTNFICAPCDFPLTPINGERCGICPYGQGINQYGYCNSCLSNMFSNSSTNNQCYNCPSYSTSDAGSSSCTTCSPGQYMHRNSTNMIAVGSCVNCPAGTYSASTLLSSSSQCIKCPANTFSDTEGSSKVNNCKPCSFGYWSEPGSTECNSCSDADTLFANPNCNACTRMKDSSARMTCSTCIGAQYYDFASSSCLNCPDGMETTIEDPLTCVSYEDNNCIADEDGKRCVACREHFVLNSDKTSCKACNEGTHYYNGTCIPVTDGFFTPSCKNENCTISQMWIPLPDGSWTLYKNGNFSLNNFIEAYFQYPVDICKSQSYPTYEYCDQIFSDQFVGSQLFRIAGLKYNNNSVLYSFIYPLPILPGFTVITKNGLNIGYKPLESGTYMYIPNGVVLPCEANYWCPGGTPPLKCPDGTFSDPGSTKIADCLVELLLHKQNQSSK